jgi:hypothetical protein
MRSRNLVVRSLPWSSLALSLSLFAPGVAHAQTAADRATARDLGIEGQKALDKKDYATAEDRFRRADQLFHAPTLLLGYARAEAGLGKVVNASEAYNRIIREAVPGAPAAFAAAVEAAKSEAGAVQARVASVTIAVVGPDNPSVTLDDQPVPVAALGVKRTVDPGQHTVKATADGWLAGETKFTVTDAGTASASLTLTKAPGAAAASAGGSGAPSGGPAGGASGGSASSPADNGSAGSTQRTIGIVGMGVGVVGLAVGAVTGILALGKHSSLATECTGAGGTCDTPAAQSDLSSYHSIGLVSTVGFIAGGVLAAGGAVLFFTAPHGASAGPATGLWITPFVGPGSVGATGTF